MVSVRSIIKALLTCAGVLVACTLSGTRSSTAVRRARCAAPARPATVVRVTPAFPALRFEQPVSLVGTPDRERWYVAERSGRIWAFSARDPETRELVLDLGDRVDASGEASGLLALAVHPRLGALFVS